MRLKAQVLLWEPVGALRDLPMAALYDGRQKQYLVERYQNVILTLESPLDLTDAPKASWHAAGFGVSAAPSVVSLNGMDYSLGDLPEVPEELCEVVRSGAAGSDCRKYPAGVLPGKQDLNQNFTKENLQYALLSGGYQVVHIASHFVLDNHDPRDSFLLLGKGQTLTLAEIEGYQTAGLDLLTLSACETAVSQTEQGKGFDSLAALAEKGGAEAVLGTLWPVVDGSTELFMKDFYALRETGLTKASALQQAQLKLLHDPRWSDPRYWGPFILIGNPR